jgi:hypothetical protein
MPTSPLCLLLVVVALAMTAPRPALGQASDEVARLRWLSGCWELRTSTRVTHEQWMAPLGGLMLGMSRTVVGAVAREHESLRIQAGDGGVVYVAQPAGQSTTSFAATSVTDTLVSFANPSHDFPQRIIYRRSPGSDSLHARIEGERGGMLRHVDFPMRRVACSEGPSGSSP